MTYEVQESIPYYTLIPTDVVTNTFHVSWVGGGSPLTADYTALCNNINTFYTTVYSPASAMAAFMRPALARQRVYDLTQPIPRVPVFSRTSALTVSQDTVPSLPTETSVCLSLKAASVPGINPGSTRGRIYLGGLGTVWGTGGSTTSFPLVSTGGQNNPKNAAVTLLAALAAANWIWVVYSRKLATPFPVVGGFIDNAFDTQRRRGQVTTARTLWP